MRQKLNNVRMSLERNSAIAYDICRQVQYLLSPGEYHNAVLPHPRQITVWHCKHADLPTDLVPPSKPTSSADEGITRSTIRQLWRDWSIEAREERNICYDPILTSIRAQVCQLDTQERASFRILVPGAGLCRLAYEITKISHGPVIANELSYHQILATHWVLNQSSAQPFEVCPWATQFSNHVKSSDQFRSYSIPELGSITHNFESEAILEPYDVHGNDHVALRCGDLFVTPDDFRDYASPEHKDTFNCVVTAFFLDTAPNVLDYITTIQNILVSGGTWLNVGPLLWNCFENGPGGRREGDGDDDEAAQLRQISDRRISGIAAETKTFDGKVEMAWDEILELIKLVGFTIEENVENLGNAGYILDCQSMLLPMYQVGYFRVTKKA